MTKIESILVYAIVIATLIVAAEFGLVVADRHTDRVQAQHDQTELYVNDGKCITWGCMWHQEGKTVY